MIFIIKSMFQRKILIKINKRKKLNNKIQKGKIARLMENSTYKLVLESIDIVVSRNIFINDIGDDFIMQIEVAFNAGLLNVI